MKTRNFARLLAALLALCMLYALFAACGKGDNGDDSKGTTTTSSSAAGQVSGDESTPTTTAEPDPLENLPTGDYKGEVFRICTVSHNWASSNILADEITGDRVEDAKYERTAQVSERLGLTFEEEIGTVAEVRQRLKNQCMSGTLDYDLFSTDPSFAYQSAFDGYLTDIGELPGVDLTAPWWAGKYNDSVNMGGKTYVAFGDTSLVYHGAFYVVVFNKNMIDEYKLEDPYDLVDSKKWTWDKMHEMMVTVAQDVNSNGAADGDKDIFGLSGHRVHFKHFLVTSNVYITDTDPVTGNPVYAGFSEKFYDAYQKMLNYFIAPEELSTIDGVSQNLKGHTGSVAGQGYYRDVFRQGRSLFITEGTGGMYMYKETDFPYGIVMFPMYEENWDEITTAVYSQPSGLVVPYTTSDAERTGAVLECMTAYSYKIVRPEFIENTLYYKYAQDPRSVEMIETILNNGSVDRSFAFNFGNISTLFDSALAAKNANITSMIKSAEKVIQATINQYVGKLSK